MQTAIQKIHAAFTHLKGYVILYKMPIAVSINLKDRTITILDDTKYYETYAKLFNESRPIDESVKNNLRTFLSNFLYSLMNSIVQESNVNIDIFSKPQWEHYFSTKFLSYPVDFKSNYVYKTLIAISDKIVSTFKSVNNTYTIPISGIPCTFTTITGTGIFLYYYKKELFEHSRIEMTASGTISVKNNNYQVKALQVNVCNIEIK